MTPPAVLAPKCGTLGVPPKTVGEAIQKATLDWRGIKVQVEIAVENRQATVQILPTSAPLLIKALKEGPRDRKKTKNVKHTGSIKLDEIYEIARKLHPKSFSKEFKGTVKQVLGTAVSVGCQVEGKSPKDIQAAIDAEEIDVPE